MFYGKNQQKHALVCQSCGTPADSTSQKFCMHCGTPLSSNGVGSNVQSINADESTNVNVGNIKVCSKCGTPADDDQKFCMRCGASLASVQTSGPAPSSEVPSNAVIPSHSELPSQNVITQDTANSYDDESYTSVLNQDPQTGDEYTTVLNYRKPPKIQLVRAKTGETYELLLPSIIGKGSAADCKISGNSAISRKHIEISKSDINDQIYMLTVLGSTNKTAIDNETIPTGNSKEIIDGQTITLADEDFVFRVTDSSSSQFSVF